MTIEADVFRFIKQHGPVLARDVSTRMKLPLWTTRKAIYRLCAKGHIKNIHDGRDGQYVSIKDRAPKDGRGTADASRQNLLLATPGEGAYAWAKKRAERRGEQYHPKPQAMTALEQAWGFLPVSRVAPANQESENAA